MLFPWDTDLTKLAKKEPTLGALVDLTEEAYGQFLRLMPDIEHAKGVYYSRSSSNPDDSVSLQLEVLEQTPYTTHIHLTHHFSNTDGRHTDPDAYLRLYHDAKQLEVLGLKQDVLPVESLYQAPGMLNKWRLLLFINRWVAFCVAQKYQFSESVLPKV